MKTNGLPHLVKNEIHFDYSSALQGFYNLSKLAITCNVPNNENISQSLHLCFINRVKHELQRPLNTFAMQRNTSVVRRCFPCPIHGIIRDNRVSQSRYQTRDMTANQLFGTISHCRNFPEDFLHCVPGKFTSVKFLGTVFWPCPSFHCLLVNANYWYYLCQI